MLSNDVKTLSPGHGLYAAFLTQQGKVVSDLRDGAYVIPTVQADGEAVGEA